ncbi:protein adenylyltransferase SelO-like [Phyllostomus hastatus]|uniref:protein adenylyltransferase SelO-like n=1 Tax=Phyllostomus hastatus TaxID=9423 RepID=UPI001E682F26|nr:protein adenylyltransferase SelO-like [Phyllostomus hastatus]
MEEGPTEPQGMAKLKEACIVKASYLSNVLIQAFQVSPPKCERISVFLTTPCFTTTARGRCGVMEPGTSANAQKHTCRSSPFIPPRRCHCAVTSAPVKTRASRPYLRAGSGGGARPAWSLTTRGAGPGAPRRGPPGAAAPPPPPARGHGTSLKAAAGGSPAQGPMALLRDPEPETWHRKSFGPARGASFRSFPGLGRQRSRAAAAQDLGHLSAWESAGTSGLSAEVADEGEVLEDILDLDLSVSETEDFIQLVSGEKIVFGSIPLAHRYGGHQFGIWADQLGDGRAHLIGIYMNRQGEKWELQLKGSGKTPYSRNGDGRAVLRSSVREFLCSEAMHYLGIPTSRAASLVVSDDEVWRDQFYNGSIVKERANIWEVNKSCLWTVDRMLTKPVCRSSYTFLPAEPRDLSSEPGCSYFMFTSIAVVLRIAKSWFRIGSLEILAHYGELDLLRTLLDFIIREHFPSVDVKEPNRYVGFFSVVVSKTAQLIALWMSVGFAHGVCNTDNFSLLSITIDYGPFGFMEAYNPGFVPNTSDDERRYKIGNQANIGMFNLNKLLQAINPLLDPGQKQLTAQILERYPVLYYKRFRELFKAKLGLLGETKGDDDLIAFLLQLMEETEADFTMTFRQLSEITQSQLQELSIPQQFWALKMISKHELFPVWVSQYLLRLKSNMNDSDSKRRERMTTVNPRYVLKNWMAESAVQKAERNDFSEVRLLQQVLRHPFQKHPAAERAGYSSPTPSWARDLRVSCSS